MLATWSRWNPTPKRRLDRQLKETQGDSEAHAAVQGFHDTVKAHRDGLRALQEDVGTTAVNPIIAVGSTLLGKAAGVIDQARTEGISKSPRDDFAAFSLAVNSYSMPRTTATGLGNQNVAKLAGKNLTDYASASERINEIMPPVVVRELRGDGHEPSGNAAAVTNRAAADARHTETN